MALGESISSRESSANQYKSKWVSIDLSGKTYAGKLVQVDEHDNSLTLQPHLKIIHFSHSLPPIYQLSLESATLVPGHAPIAIMPTSEEELAYSVQEANRDVALASRKREEELQKYDLEHKIRETGLRQLLLPFPK